MIHSIFVYQVKVKIFNAQKDPQDFRFCHSSEEGTTWQSVVSVLVLTERKFPKSSRTYRHLFCWNRTAAETYKQMNRMVLRNNARKAGVSYERHTLGLCIASGCEKRLFGQHVTEFEIVLCVLVLGSAVASSVVFAFAPSSLWPPLR